MLKELFISQTENNYLTLLKVKIYRKKNHISILFKNLEKNNKMNKRHKQIQNWIY